MALPPIPSPQQQVLSQQLANLIQQKIKQAGGWIDFATFMHMALYTPGLGYYAGGARKFGSGGDFVTAPEISSLFSKTMALQAAQILAYSDGDILELGAGTGRLAADLLLELQQLDQLPKQYFILEVSDYLRQVQRETCHKYLSKDLFSKLIWLETLPQHFTGLVLGNEVLDAIPVHLIHNTHSLQERGVAFENEFIWQDKPLTAGKLFDEISASSLPSDYLTEVCPAATGLINSLANMLKQGVILMLDYGFSAREYYHPQRNRGTLMCHYQHYAHSNPLANVGLQDITAHVNFSQIAMLCELASMRLAGYANQAQFLINCGILDILAQHSPNDSEYMKLAAAVQKLLSPAEMGELFKVIALSKGIEEDLIGFKSGDKAHTL